MNKKPQNLKKKTRRSSREIFELAFTLIQQGTK